MLRTSERPFVLLFFFRFLIKKHWKNGDLHLDISEY